MEARIIRSLAEVEAAEWNALPGAEAPFLRHEFLHALETTGCATAATGWDAHHILVRERSGALAGALPLYLKSHSWGEFVFDFAWAEAYQRAGLLYYPRLVSAVPFTPATGPRLLAAGERVRAALIEAARVLAPALQASSLHVLFPRPDDRETLESAGLMARLDVQFHWENAGYGTFDDFLAGFTAAKRKKLRRERRRIEESGIACRTLTGAELDPGLIDVIHGLHATTFARHGHAPYLNRAFFGELARVMPGNLVVELASVGGEFVACAILLRGADTLVWALLGRQRRLPQPAFRALLLPRHRVLHSREARPIRARHAGRAQAPAWLPARIRMVHARDRGSPICRGDRRMARARARGPRRMASRSRDTPALPARRHPG